MIASPGDVAEERNIVTEEIHRWNDANASVRQLVLLPVKWETHSTPEMGHHPQAIINRQLLNDADIVIAIFGTRIGTPTEEYVSGTVEEIKKHVAAGKTAKIYFSDVPVAPSAVNAAQYASVLKFREECQSDGLYATFDSLEQFRRDFSHHLDIEMNQPRYRWLPALEPLSRSDDADLSGDALRLLKAAAASDDGLVISQETLDGYGLHAGDEEFVDGTARSAARWRAAMEELVEISAMEPLSEGVYRVTAAGYRVADRNDTLKQDAPPQLSPFDEHQKTHARGLIDSLHYMQRDLLRLLLLKGGSARGDVISLASTNSAGTVDINQLCQPLVHKGLITQMENLPEGHTTYAVNGGITDVLKEILFPRREGNDTPFFKGIPVVHN
jgi:hypothetical protein